jgi:pilus assembly protein Flp/PilA
MSPEAPVPIGVRLSRDDCRPAAKMEVSMLRLYVATLNLKYSAVESIHRLRGDKEGVTAIEYGLIAGAIAVAIIGTVVTLGSDIKNMFTAVGNALNSSAGGAAN